MMEYSAAIGGGRKSKTACRCVARDFRKTREEYGHFPLYIFRDRLYAEVRKQTGEALWV